MPKPDSACKYLKSNNGPDGVAIFYRNSSFECDSHNTKVLEAFGASTNQVVLAMNLIQKETGDKLCVVTTHLKARKGDLLANIREQQASSRYLRQITILMLTPCKMQ